MNSKNNNNNHRAYAYGRAHETEIETEICHGGRLGCWVESRGAIVSRWARRVVEGLAFAVLIFGLCAVCAVA